MNASRAFVSSGVILAAAFLVLLCGLAVVVESKFAPTKLPDHVRLTERGQFVAKAEPTLGDAIVAGGPPKEADPRPSPSDLARLTPDEQRLINGLVRDLPAQIESTFQLVQTLEKRREEVLGLEQKLLSMRNQRYQLAAFRMDGEPSRKVSEAEAEQLDQEIGNLWNAIKDARTYATGSENYDLLDLQRWRVHSANVQTASANVLGNRLTIQNVEDLKLAAAWVEHFRSLAANLEPKMNRLVGIIHELGYGDHRFAKSVERESSEPATYKLPPAIQRFVDNQKAEEADRKAQQDWIHSVRVEAGADTPTAGTPQHLKSLIKDIEAARQRGDAKRAAEITRAFFPDAAGLRRGLSDIVPQATIDALAEATARFRERSDDVLANVIAPSSPDKTELVVALTPLEFLAKQTPNSNWPSLLRREVTYYDIAFQAPGTDQASAAHLFYWTGSRWYMLGRIWESLPK